MENEHSEEVLQGKRFQFGANWHAFLKTLNDERIREAEVSLQSMLGMESLSGKRFLDIGSGSGLFSLAARRLGATVHSFDFDPMSVACTTELMNRYFPGDDEWIVEEGSALDTSFLQSLGQFDVVYSWGVLHHTGNMMKALENANLSVADNGMLYIAIYNDEGLQSKLWAAVKKTYCSGWAGRLFISCIFIPYFALRSVAVGILKHKNPLGLFWSYKARRGMSIYHDWIDWLGGYPFEVAKPEKIVRFYLNHGFVLKNLITTNRSGCNEFAFLRESTRNLTSESV